MITTQELPFASLNIAVQYLSSMERAHLAINFQDTVTADGVSLQVFETFLTAKARGKLVTRPILLAKLKDIHIDAAERAGLIRLEDAGFYSVAFEDVLDSGRKKSRSAKIKVQVDQPWNVSLEQLEPIYSLYPKRGGQGMGKLKGMQTLTKKLRSDELPAFLSAVENVRSLRQSCTIKADEFVPQWSTFANNWKDWLPENTEDQNGPFSSF